MDSLEDWLEIHGEHTTREQAELIQAIVDEAKKEVKMPSNTWFCNVCLQRRHATKGISLWWRREKDGVVYCICPKCLDTAGTVTEILNMTQHWEARVSNESD